MALKRMSLAGFFAPEFIKTPAGRPPLQGFCLLALADLKKED